MQQWSTHLHRATPSRQLSFVTQPFSLRSIQAFTTAFSCLPCPRAGCIIRLESSTILHRTQVWAVGGNIQPGRHHRTRSVLRSTSAHRLFTCALNRSHSYALTTSLTHNAHTGLFSVMIFVLTGFALMTRVNFAKVRVILVEFASCAASLPFVC